MKLVYAGAIVALSMFTAPQMADAAVFAGHLQMVSNLDGTYALSYRLNEDANQGVTINIKDATNTIVRTITGNPTTKGAHTVQWDGRNNGNVAVGDGTYTWEVVASANNPGNSYTKIDLSGLNQAVFGRPFGIAVDKTTTSPHFGNIYIGNVGPADLGRPTETGIYVLANDLSDHTGQGDTAYTGNAGFVFPFEIDVAASGEVFIADNGDANSNVFIMDPANPTGDFSRLFDDTGRNSAGLNATNGTVYGLHVEGTGENMKLYTMDEEYGTGTGAGGSAWVYDIGETRSGYATPPTALYDDAANGNRVINYTGEIHPDTNPNRTGWFLSQTRDNESETNPNFFHFDGTTIDWTSYADFNFWLNQNYDAGFDLNADSTRMVAAGFGWVQVLDISDLYNMTDSSILFSDSGAGAVRHRGVRFDPAENFYIHTNITELLYYYSKQGENTFTTPNPVGAEIVIGASNVAGWGLY